MNRPLALIDILLNSRRLPINLGSLFLKREVLACVTNAAAPKDGVSLTKLGILISLKIACFRI
ncbi:hypothetical protein [Paenibacillus sp. MMO-177]|uniref:hypothetical protein n=1 Tax=Paenibacillus sp. MMO-177 TaxID=3081289 RepID=UPI00301ABAB5